MSGSVGMPRGTGAREGVHESLSVRITAALPLAWRVFVLWLATRLGYVAITYMANQLHVFQVSAQNSGGMFFSWQRWDSNWYMIVSRLGYQSETAANFFPLYPGLVGAISWLFGHGSGPVYPAPDQLRLAVAIVVSNLGLLVGMYAIARLAQHDAGPQDEGAGMRTVWFLIAYPFSMAFAAPLAEGLFLAFVGLTLLYARQGKWYLAAGPALLAGLTRPVAVVLFAPLVWEFGRQQGWWRWPPARPALGALVKGAVGVGAAPAGMCIYFTYLYFRFGDFLLPLHDQIKLWRHVSMPLWQTAQLIFQNLTSGKDSVLLLTESVTIVLFAVITIAGIRRIPFAYTLFMASLLYLDTAAPVTFVPDVLTGTTRYLAASIPVFLILGRWAGRHPWLQTLWVCTGMMLQGVIMVSIFQGKLSA